MNAVRMVAATALYLAGALLITMMAAATVFGIPSQDLGAVAQLLAMVGGAASLCALLVVHPAIQGQVGGVRMQLAGASLVGSLLLLGMMLAGAGAMFISEHDLAVLLTMLLFSALLAVGFSLWWAGPITNRLMRLRGGTAELARGKLDTTISVDGRDEIAELACALNDMAQALRMSARRAQELEQGRRDLIAAVSHDLRTPLASIQALIEAVADGVAADPETEARYLRSVQHEITHLGRLVDDLFQLAQIDAGVLQLNLQYGSLRDLISDTLSSLQPQAERQGVQLIGEVDSSVDPVLMSPPKLQRVFHNLISNALRHTSAAGTIFLRAAPVGRMVEVVVADTGEGIPPEDLPHIFEPSFRGERSRTRSEIAGTSGAGLGLTIARGLIEAHGGTISVESQAGSGTRFCFTLRRG